MKTFHLLFEQSGTFKNVLISYGYKAKDYDILNEYNETDIQIDLFKEIELEYDNIINQNKNITIFSKMNKDQDFIIAFFPCTHFCDSNQLQYRLYNAGKRLAYDNKAVKRLIKRNNERAKYFELYLKFTFICKYKGISTIIENPASSGNKNYLVQFSPIDVAFYEKDRTLFGDKFKKPTNFFSINFEMKENFKMFDLNLNKKNVMKDCFGCKARSEITSKYANNFYLRFLENKV